MDEESALLVDHEPGVTHDAKVLRNRPLGDVEPGGECIGAQSPAFQQLHDSHPRFDGQHLQLPRQPLRLVHLNAR